MAEILQEGTTSEEGLGDLNLNLLPLPLQANTLAPPPTAGEIAADGLTATSTGFAPTQDGEQVQEVPAPVDTSAPVEGAAARAEEPNDADPAWFTPGDAAVAVGGKDQPAVDYAVDTAVTLANSSTKAWDATIHGVNEVAWIFSDEYVEDSDPPKDYFVGDALTFDWKYAPKYKVNEYFVGPVAQFAIGLVGAGKVLKALGWVGKGFFNVAGRSTVAGAASDATVFEGHDPGMSDAIVALFPEAPQLFHVLANEKSSIEGRLKKLGDGALLGPLSEVALWGIRSLWHGIHGNADAAAEALAKAEELKKNALLNFGVEQELDAAAIKFKTQTSDQTGINFDSNELAGLKAGEEVPGQPNVAATGGEPPQALTVPPGFRKPDQEQAELPLGDKGVGVKEPTLDELLFNERRRMADPDWAEVQDLQLAQTRHLVKEGTILRSLEDANRMFNTAGEDMLHADSNVVNWSKIETGEDVRALVTVFENANRENIARAKAAGLTTFEGVRMMGEKMAADAGGNLGGLLRMAQKDLDLMASMGARQLAYKTVYIGLAERVMSLRDFFKDAVSQTKNIGVSTWAREHMAKFGDLNALSPSALRKAQEDATLIARAELMHISGLTLSLQSLIGGLGTMTGRNLNFYKVVARDSKAFLSHMAQGETKEVFDKLLSKLNKATDLDDIGKTLRLGWLETVVGMNNEFFINAILFGTGTHIVNASSSAARIWYSPIEEMAGAIVGLDKAGFKRGMNTLLVTNLQYGAAAKNAWKAFKSAESRLDPPNPVTRLAHNSVDMENKFWWSSENAAVALGPLTRPIAYAAQKAAKLLGAKGGKKPPMKQSFVDSQGKINLTQYFSISKLFDLGGSWGINMSRRLMGSADEYMKTVAYNSRVYALARESADTLGLRGNAADAHVRAKIAASINRFGAFTDEEAMIYAREQVFTSDLEAGLGKTAEMIVARHPLLRMVMPFVRTPVNLFRFTVDRTPGVNLMTERFRKQLMGGRTEAEFLKDARTGHLFRTAESQKAAGKIIMGSTFWTMALTAAINGDCIGGYNRNKEMANLQRQAGVLDYSCRVPESLRWMTGGAEYFQYKRMSPWADFFGFASDMVDAYAHMDEGTWEEIGVSVITSFLEQISNKTFMSSAVDAMQVFGGDENATERFIKGMAGGYGGFTKDLQRWIDGPGMKATRGLLDKFLSRFPGNTVPLDYDIFGAVIRTPPGFLSNSLSPYYVTPAKDGSEDTYREVFRQYEMAGQAPGSIPERLGSINLGSLVVKADDRELYALDRYKQLVGVVTIEGMTVKKAMKTLLASEEYNSLPDNSTKNLPGKRLELIKSVIEAYRKEAFNTLLRENKGALIEIITQEVMAKAINDGMTTAQAEEQAKIAREMIENGNFYDN